MQRNPETWELRSLEDIQDFEEEWKVRFGREPFRVSHWDPERTTREFLERLLPPPAHAPASLFEYTYPNDDDAWNRRLLLDFGLGSGKGFVVTPSSTNTTVLATSMLKRNGCTRVSFVTPFYYSALRVAQEWSMDTAMIAPSRQSGSPALDPGALEAVREGDALWITNPLYSIGHYWGDEATAPLIALADRGVTLVLDESLCLPGAELARAIGHHERVWSVLSPTKSICLNGAKFSALMLPVDLLADARRQSDILCGALQSSSLYALDAYLSGRLSSIAPAFEALLDERRQRCHSLLSGLRAIRLDAHTRGHFISCFFPGIPARAGRDALFLRSAFEHTKSTFIPGNRAYMPDEWGFSFRINLARLCDGDGPRLRALVEFLVDAHAGGEIATAT